MAGTRSEWCSDADVLDLVHRSLDHLCAQILPDKLSDVCLSFWEAPHLFTFTPPGITVWRSSGVGGQGQGPGGRESRPVKGSSRRLCCRLPCHCPSGPCGLLEPRPPQPSPGDICGCQLSPQVEQCLSALPSPALSRDNRSVSSCHSLGTPPPLRPLTLLFAQDP